MTTTEELGRVRTRWLVVVGGWAANVKRGSNGLRSSCCEQQRQEAQCQDRTSRLTRRPDEAPLPQATETKPNLSGWARVKQEPITSEKLERLEYGGLWLLLNWAVGSAG